MTRTNKIVDALLGVAVADAVGVPFEFRSRQQMKVKPASDMIGYGTYNQPPGTWSDDSSLTFCLVDALTKKGYDLVEIAQQFIAWKEQNHWSARGELFDIGITTSKAITNLKKILETGDYEALSQQRYLGDEYENGNGSLMRILPLLFYIRGKKIEEQFEICWDVSALTHRHIRAAMSCLIYLRLAEHLLGGLDKEKAYFQTQQDIQSFWKNTQFNKAEQTHFQRVIQSDIRDLKEDTINSKGYVIDTLEASFWCFLNLNSYEKTILQSINLGNDTDTTAAVAGGLAGLYYGAASISKEWLSQLARLEDIIDLGNRMYIKYF